MSSLRIALDNTVRCFYYLAMDDSAIRELCRKYGIELLVLFGSLADESDRPGSDVDLAVKMPKGGQADKLELIYHLGSLFPDREVDLVVLSMDTDPVLLFEIFSIGKPLYQSREGVFDEERVRACKLYYDTDKFRRLRSDYLKKITKGNRHVA